MKINTPLVIGDVVIDNRLSLAPMAGFTDLAFRQLAKEYGVGLVYTELISANALAFNSKKTYKMIEETKRDKSPVCLQLFGDKIENLVQTIKKSEEISEYDILDINLGCSVKKVQKQGAGAWYIDHPKELREMLMTVCQTSTKPVSVKTRIGAVDNSLEIFENLKIFEESGVKLIALHGRTRSALYSGDTNYDVIKRVVDSTKLPVIANGNINLKNYRKILDYTNASGIMIGRDSIGYPSIFRDILNIDEGLELEPISLHSQTKVLIHHLELMKPNYTEFELVSKSRAFIGTYFKSFNNIKPYRLRLTRCTSYQEILDILNEILSIEDERRILQ